MHACIFTRICGLQNLYEQSMNYMLATFACGLGSHMADIAYMLLDLHVLKAVKLTADCFDLHLLHVGIAGHRSARLNAQHVKVHSNWQYSHKSHLQFPTMSLHGTYRIHLFKVERNQQRHGMTYMQPMLI